MARTVIGLTGAFGSGCSTAAEHLRHRAGFTRIRLSEPIRSRWRELHGATEPKRQDLQRLGDELRAEHGRSVLGDRALAGVGDGVGKIVVDGIRNIGEVERLRQRFGYDFTLVAVLAPADVRWDRLSGDYLDLGLGEADFYSDDARDRDEETEVGQQVDLCIDLADVFIDNSDTVTPAAFRREVTAVVALVTGAKPRPATWDEIHMHMAYGASHGSKCLKRHVGAVLVDAAGQVVGVGYNENPPTTNPCAEEPKYGRGCYRDIIRNQHFRVLSERRVRCPQCGEPLPVIQGPPWRCPSCAAGDLKTNLEAFFFPDRAMNWCTAIHAEAAAFSAAGERARGGTLYTTTFPCMQCAEKIIQAGIEKVVFTEAYPDPHSLGRLELAGVTASRFKGVRSSAFERIFGSLRPR